MLPESVIDKPVYEIDATLDALIEFIQQHTVFGWHLLG